MSVLLEFAMFPTDKGESVSPYVSRIIDNLQQQQVKYQLTAMGTIIETETLPEALELMDQSYKLLAPDCQRVYCTAKLDIRSGEAGRMKQKIVSVEKLIQKD